MAEPKLAWEQTTKLEGLVGMSIAIGQEGQVAVLASGSDKTHVVTMTQGSEGVAKEVDPDVERVLYSSNGQLLLINKAGAFRLGTFYANAIADR